MKCDDFLMLICHIMLWPWPLTRWPWKFVVGLRSRVIVCGKFDRNRRIPGWVIHNLANFGPCYLTLWPWPLTPWPWTYMVDGAWSGQCMYQIWARSLQPRLSYWRLTTDFSSVLEGAPIPRELFQKRVDRSAPNLVGTLPDDMRTPSLKMVKISCSVSKPQRLKSSVVER